MPAEAKTEADGRVTLVVEDRRWVAFSKDGGGLEKDTSTIRPGGGEAEEILSSQPKREDVTLELLQRSNVATQADLAWLEAACKRDAEAKVIDQPLDPNGHATGEPHTDDGTLKAVKRSKRDTGSADAAKFTVVVTVKA